MAQSSYIPAGTLGRWLDQPFCLPQTILFPGTSILVSSIKLPAGYRLSLRWLSLHFVDITTQATVITKVTTNMAMTFAGLYCGAFENLNLHCGQPLVYVPGEVPGYTHMDPFYWRDFESPDTYAVLAVNNTKATQLRVSVAGTFRLTKL
jgi:hypothetical protein